MRAKPGVLDAHGDCGAESDGDVVGGLALDCGNLERDLGARHEATEDILRISQNAIIMSHRERGTTKVTMLGVWSIYSTHARCLWIPELLHGACGHWRNRAMLEHDPPVALLDVEQLQALVLDVGLGEVVEAVELKRRRCVVKGLVLNRGVPARGLGASQRSQIS